MNHFADRRISVLQLLEDGTREPLTFVYEAGRGRPDLRVQLIDFSRLSIQQARTEPLHFDFVALASPGRAVRLGGRDLHLQFLRPENRLSRGPLLIFEGGDPLPCFMPRHPLLTWWRAARRNVLLPTLGDPNAGDPDSRKQEFKRSLYLAENLMQGLAVPGRADDAYFVRAPPA
jgi:hypothetical protein